MKTIQVIVLLVVHYATIQAKPNNCASSDECCQSGGQCGDSVFDQCEGKWDYSKRCNPSYRTCCMPNTIPTTPTTQPTTPGQTGPTTPRTSFPPPTECGIRPGVSDSHIVGGEEAVAHSWPWSISLELDYYGWGGWEHHCGGSLITNRHVLTAAHCIAKSGVSDPALFRVILGMHYQERAQWTGSEIVVPVETAFVHEDYSTTIAGSPNDIAIIKLARDVEFTKEIAPICLPEVRDIDFTGMDSCYIAGFGVTQGTGRDDVLNEAKIDVITNELCDNKWETGSGRVGLIQKTHICAGNGVPGTCNGDSGGPLQCEVVGQYVIAGATSFGAAGCTAENAPDVYTRISHFLPWIQEKLAL